MLPVLVWIARNMALARTATSYDIRFLPITEQEWSWLFETVNTWIRPIEDFKFSGVKLAILLVTLPIAFLFFKKREILKPSQTQLKLLLAVYAAFYVLFVLTSRLIVYPLVTFYQDRLLYPALVCLFCLALYGLCLLQQAARKRSLLIASFLAAIYMIVVWGYIRSNAAAQPPYIQPLLVSRQFGLGLQAQGYVSESLVEKIKQLPSDDIFFTDDTQRLYFFTGRSSSYVGDLTQSDIEMLRGQSLKCEVVVVFFNDSPEHRKVLQQQIPQLELIYGDESGRVIYQGKRTP